MKKPLFAFLLFPLMLLSTSVYAADYLEEITVTATKKEEAAHEVPISITVLSGNRLSDMGMSSSDAVDEQTPNFQMRSSFGVTAPNLAMRGVGNLSFFAATTTVGVYSDGVFIAQPIAQGFQMFDLERVEILRGPQGTLFGRNTTGGLVNFIPVKPQVGETMTGSVSLTVAEENTFDTEAAVSVPVGDTAAMRLAFIRRASDGFFENANPAADDRDVAETEFYAGRLLLNWEPSDSFSLLFNAHFGNANNDAAPYKGSYVDNSQLAPRVVDPSFPPVPAFILFPTGVGNCPPGSTPGGFLGGCASPFSPIPFFGGTPHSPHSDDPYSIETSLNESHEDVNTYGFSATITLDAGNYSFVSVTGWDSAKRDRFGDDDASYDVSLDEVYLDDTEYFSQELRVISQYKGPFNFQAGLYYYTDEIDSQIHGSVRDSFVGIGTSLLYKQENESWAVFGSMEFDLTEKWQFRAGVRLTGDERRISGYESFLTNAGAAAFLGLPIPSIPAGTPISPAQARSAFFGPLIGPLSLEEDWFDWSGNASLAYFFAEDTQIYAAFSRGFKGGDLGIEFFNPAAVVIVDPETVRNYEIGLKASGLLNDTLNFSVAGFFTQIFDQHILVDLPGAGGFFPVLDNAGESEIYGVEVELAFQPTPAWYFSFGGGYLDATFKELVTGTTDLSGNRLPNAPEFNFNGVTRYEAPVANGVVSVQVDWHWNDDTYLGVFEEPEIKIPSYGVVNARLGYRFMQDKAEVAVFVRNLLEDEYYDYAFNPNNALFGGNVFIPGKPRWFGGTISYQF